MLQGYFDDSGNEPQSRVFLLSGFILDTEQWAKFSDEWNFQLHRGPGIDYFKMSQAANRNGQFQGFSPEFVLCKIRDLLSVIDHYKPSGISCLVDWRDYENEFASLAHGDLKNPYPILFQLVFMAIKAHQKNLGIYPTPIDVDFDEQGKFGEFALQLYGDMKADFPENWKKMLGRMPIMLDDKKVLPLQAADMLAWIERYSILKGNQGPDEWDWLYEQLNPLVKVKMRYDAEDLKYIVRMKEQLGL